MSECLISLQSNTILKLIISELIFNHIIINNFKKDYNLFCGLTVEFWML